MTELIVNEKFDNKKIISYLNYMFPNLSNSIIYKTLRKKDIKLNSKRISENTILHTGDKLEIYINDEILNNTILPIVYEDSNILIVNKPSNIEVVGDNSISSILSKKYSYIEPCHRIDRNTIGLVLFAKNKAVLNDIINAFKNNEIEKHYIALCYGIPKEEKSTLSDYLFKDSKKSMVYISNAPKKGYVKIITSYKVLKHNKIDNLSILDVTLHTGKTHQIRAHLAYYNLPIIGDGKYGINDINKKYKLKTQALCSYSLCFHFEKENNISNLNNKVFKLDKIPFLEYLGKDI